MSFTVFQNPICFSR